MIKFKAWDASNSRAIAKFPNAEIGHFGHDAFIHELIRGSLGFYLNSRPGKIMIRTGDEYRASLQDGREVYISGERVKDVTTHPMLMVMAIIPLLPLKPEE